MASKVGAIFLYDGLWKIEAIRSDEKKSFLVVLIKSVVSDTKKIKISAGKSLYMPDFM